VTSLAAGGTANVAGGVDTMVLFDGTGAAGIMNLPANGVATNGQRVTVAIKSGAPANPSVVTQQASLKVNPGAGNQMTDPGNPGAFLTTATGQTLTTPGSTISYVYTAATVAPATAPAWTQIG
jgi:hypothetical protein